jgi:MerR HTH family regulatory protein
MLDMLGQTVVTPSESEATIKADELERLANELGVNKRRLEEWRARGLIPRPALAGYEGKRPVWVYPARAAKQLRAIVRLRKNTRDLDAIRAALWAQGYPVPTEAVRSSLLTVIDRFEQAMVRDLARFTPEGMTVTDLQHDPDALRAALVAYADELARRRSRSPLTRKVRMSAAERQRGMFYMLAPFFDQPRDEADAILAERLYGISRGRSGTARGALELPPSEHFPRNPLTADVLRAGVEAADDRTFAFVGAMLHSTLSSGRSSKTRSSSSKTPLHTRLPFSPPRSSLTPIEGARRRNSRKNSSTRFRSRTSSARSSTCSAPNSEGNSQGKPPEPIKPPRPL